MSSFSFCSVSFTDAETGMHDGGFFDDEAVGVKFSNVLAGVGVADFGGFIWIEPDFTFAAVEDFGGKGLLGAEVGHFEMRVGRADGGWMGGGRMQRCAVFAWHYIYVFNEPNDRIIYT